MFSSLSNVKLILNNHSGIAWTFNIWLFSMSFQNYLAFVYILAKYVIIRMLYEAYFEKY